MSDLDKLICKDCEFLKYSCGEDTWSESIGCYKHCEPKDNKCDEYKKDK